MGFDLYVIAATALAWLIGSYLFWRFIAAPMMKKWIKNTILGMLSRPDKDVTFAVEQMFTLAWNWFLKPAPTGRMKKSLDEEGNSSEVPELLSPYEQIISESAKIIFMKFKGAAGGRMNQAGAQLAESDPQLAAMLGMGLGPRKGQSTVEWAVEQFLAKKGPEIMDTLAKKLIKTEEHTGGW